ncbi:hypothetical protein CampHawk_139 [Bacillus phage CampHawk]|uniref:Uncharacterized protein n=2 Tax=Okubovirus camphawk TaxID=1986015 RepID=U5PWT5_9CAUD|nr:hypothetical protein CampHawk_139 [Bacillus phage CampHawk]AGY47017.1 hypothetical protein CampHawk_139 [Bacillus phage CampHawk]APZ82374.1 hypothetical protein Goe2_c13800 [Bacillus phage vB_BsuM-Goe2]UNY49092.1 hypothetical protein sp82g_155 [Bacillus phage SP82G]WCS68778.1 hypothetical protein Goe19_01370 [Bacillus phage vB_BsuM-Goe19]
MEQATVVSQVAIDVGPEGIRFSFEGMDNDLAELISQAKEFEVIEKGFLTNDSSTLTIRSKKKIAFVDRPAEEPTEPVEETTDTV